MTEVALNDRVKTNLDNIEANIREKNLDWVHANVGQEGSTKSSLAILMAKYLDPEFDPEKQIAMNGKSFRKKASRLGSFKPIVFDEGIEGLYGREAMKKENKKTVKFLRKCRDMNLFIFLCLPDYMELDKSIREKRVKSLTRCVKQGWGWFYGKSEINQLIEDDGDWPDPPFRAGWGDPAVEHVDLWEKYQSLKQEDIRELEEDQEEDDDVEWLSVSEFADSVGVTKKTIRNWCNDNKLKYGRLPNGNRRIPSSEVDEVLKEYGRGSDEEDEGTSFDGDRDDE